MRRVILLAALVIAVPRTGAAAPAAPSGGPQDAQAPCASERDVIERRRKLFESEKLSPAEIGRRNESHARALDECRERAQAEAERARERQQDLDALARRAGADATEREREAHWRDIRRDRLGSKHPATLTPEERAELSAGTGDELQATHRAIDEAHGRDPQFMRIVHTAIACSHGDRRADLKDAISSEERMIQLGTGDRQKFYALRSELRQVEDILARNDDELRALPGAPERCGTVKVAIVAHCLAARLSGARAPAGCESEEIQQYLRFVR